MHLETKDAFGELRRSPVVPAHEGSLTLEICVSTIGIKSRRLNPDRLPAGAGIAYSLLVQGLADPAERLSLLTRFAARSDVRVHFLGSLGVASSRNAALAVAKGDIVLFADDDLTFLPQNFERLRTAFESDDDLACICGVCLDEGGQRRKSYGRHMSPLRYWNIARVGTPEIAVRRVSVLARSLRFDERFGAGTRLPIGDEFIFLADLLKAGLTGRHVDLPLCSHPRSSSGLTFDEPSLDVRRAVFRRALGRVWYPYLCAFAFKNFRRFPSLRSGLDFIRPTRTAQSSHG